MMTQERKDELLKDALRLIGVHLDEEENAPRALKNFLGMTAEEMIELGVEGADSPKLTIRAQFDQKVKDNFEAYNAEWRQMQPDALIEKAAEIAAIRLMAQQLPYHASDEDMEYLVCFKNPLEVVSDQWLVEHGPDSVIDDAMMGILGTILDTRDAEQIYEMEPEFSNQAPQQTHAP